VLGQTIDEALKNGRKDEEEGYTFSYDMLGEAALTADDADIYFASYADAITKLTPYCTSQTIAENPGISIKLSALHPRYEEGQRERVMAELVPRTLKLAQQACQAGMGLNIDAEEADRLDLSLDIIEAVLSDPALKGWDGFGVVVQAYGKRAGPAIDWLHALASKLDRKIMVRLVKGAYWDTEIKLAQAEGLEGYPVFTRKAATDVSYLTCARKLLGMTDRIYPQFATHNAHSVSTILAMADDSQAFEFQRLHGMGEILHAKVRTHYGSRCRIYAPVGAHHDLLAYLVRRLLENGANSSFINQINDPKVSPQTVAADPFASLEASTFTVGAPVDLFAPQRRNSRGWDLRDRTDIADLEEARAPFKNHQWHAHPLVAGDLTQSDPTTVTNPADPNDAVGTVIECSQSDIEIALAAAKPWNADATTRAKVLERASDLFEQSYGELFAVLTREAGKTPLDAIAELREAVDFLRYYGAQAELQNDPARGLFTCISPWNFPLAIFTGQIAAALATGNGVLAKPAEPAAITAFLAVKLMHQAGVPADALQLLPGTGATVGASLTSDERIKGVCFTGSTATAQTINRTMSNHLEPTAPLIAETGGLNAMIVDSTALPEQAIKDILASAFQSAGQRCSALRMLYVQADVAERFLTMLYGAMDELRIGNPWNLSSDSGPLITGQAQTEISDYLDTARSEQRLLKQVDVPPTGFFIPPSVIKVSGIDDLPREIFGPVLHVATFEADELDAVLDAVNAKGYGLTFGLHTRIDDRVAHVTDRLKVGNIYINRNQIGAVVGSQPFGGEGLSGTGPKAGGPSYVKRFTRPGRTLGGSARSNSVETLKVQALLNAITPSTECLYTADLPGPTGESNRYSVYGRGMILCLGPTAELARQQMDVARSNGCTAIGIAPGLSGENVLDGHLATEALATLQGFDGVAFFGPDDALRTMRKVLAGRNGKLIPLFGEGDLAERCQLERHICIDTTAAGGNASLLAGTGG
jgi:RHH-type proline utilization regulon transcriptional repressor/proline dehydrogenase/delta 1-pyrroline-5-carboxylate dehydrogenase